MPNPGTCYFSLAAWQRGTHGRTEPSVWSLFCCNHIGYLVTFQPTQLIHHQGSDSPQITLLHEITESLRLEKTSTIILSNHSSTTNTDHWPHPSVPHLHGSWTPPGMVTPPSPWAAVLLHHHSHCEDSFPSIQPEPPQGTTESNSLSPYHKWYEKRDQLLSPIRSESCRDRQGLSWASSRMNSHSSLNCSP